ncbi:roadblock/LC7 domain-containing protein [candidate division KSB1 bacterium]|nr:roadblock/LC7 domain-containing protein [candidate division KSB1 bacterium]
MKVGKGGNGQQIILSGEMYKSITEILSELLMKTKARLIIFADMDGHAITQKGTITGLNINTLAALAAGHYAATAEMANILGESDRFRYIFHEGHDMNMYCCNVGDHFLLTVVFDISTALGMVRIFTNRTIQSLETLLSQQQEMDDKAREFLDIEFSTLLNQELDKTFNNS